MMHKYLFIAIENGQCVARHFFNSRNKGFKKLEKSLRGNVMVDEIVYHDARKHLQEFICSDGSRFLIYRV
jgi:hypothetical protein